MTPRLAPVLTELDLPLPELMAARMDGELYAVGDGFAPIDEFEQAHHRALSLSVMSRPRLIAERMTAAWVHGARHRPPRVPEFCVSHSARVRARPSTPHSPREVVIADDEIVTFGAVSVTSPLRTAIDLLRGERPFDHDHARAVRLLLESGQFSLENCRSAIAGRHRLAGKKRALERLSALESDSGGDAIDVVDSVDAPYRVEHAIKMRGVPHLEDESTDCKTVS